MTEPKHVDEQWLSEQIHKFGLHNPHLFGCANGDFLEFDVNDKRYSIEIAEVVEVGDSHSDFQSEQEKVLDCRQEVKDFAVLMEQKLRKNDHKISWKKCNQEYLLQRLDDEVKELHECFFIYSPADMNFLMDGQHEDRIPGEAADVANFAMMLWDNFGDKELRKQEQP